MENFELVLIATNAYQSALREVLKLHRQDEGYPNPKQALADFQNAMKEAYGLALDTSAEEIEDYPAF